MRRLFAASRPSDRRRALRKRPFAPEWLEGRALMATYTWIGGATGNFNLAANWLGPNNVNAVPGAGDDASTNGGQTLTVTAPTTVNSFSGGGAIAVASGQSFTVNNAVNLPNSTIDNLTVAAGATFTASAETTTLTGAAAISGSLVVPAGATLVFAGTGNGINLNAGATLAGAGTYLINSNLAVDAAITAPQQLVMDSGNNYGIFGPGTLTVPSGATLEWRSGTMGTVGGSTIVAPGGILALDSTNAKILQDRSLVNNGTATWTGTGSLAISGDGVLTNAATMAIQNDQAISGNGIFANTGTLTKTSTNGTGTTDIVATFNNSGKTIAQSGILQLDDGGTNTGEFNIPGAGGVIDITGKNYNLNAGATVTGSGTLHLTTGFLGPTTVNLNTILTVPNLAIDDGSISGPGSLTVPGLLSMANGTVAISGPLALPTGSTLTMNGVSQTATFSNVTVNAAGSASLSGTEAFALGGSATFNNSGTFAIQDDTVGNVGGLNLGGTTFNNTGTITKTSLNAPTGSSTISNGTFTNSGKVSVLGGQLLFDLNGLSTGNFNAAANAAVLLTRSWNLNAGTTFTGAGTFGEGLGFFGYGTIAVNAGISAPNFSLPGGTLAVGPNVAFTVASFNWSSGTISGNGTVANPAGGTLTIFGSGTKSLDTATLSNSGVANWSGLGQIALSNGAILYNQAGGAFSAINDQSIAGNGTFNDAGALNKYSLTGVGTTSISAPINILPGGSINLASGNVSTDHPLTNVGTINLGSQSVLTVSNNYIQPNAGTLNVAVGGAPATALFGQLVIAGTASLNGTLGVARVGNFVPTAGQVTPILTYISVAGNFVNFNLPSSGLSTLFAPSIKTREYDLIAGVIIQPSAPTGLAILPADDTGGPGVTAIHAPRLTGQAQPGLLVQVYGLVNGQNTLVASGFAGPNGSFTLPPSLPLAPGTYSLKAMAVDLLGQSSPAGAPFSLTITPPPSAPTNLAILPADDTGGPGVTAIHAPRLTGKSSPGALVQIYNVGGATPVLVATAFALMDGTFTATMLAPMAPGTYTLKAVAVDLGGNYGAASSPFTLTITPPPSAPTNLAILPADDTNGPGVTRNKQPRLTGKTAPGLLVQIYNVGGATPVLFATAFAAADGSFTASTLATLAPGTYTLKAAAIDAGGNFGVASAPFTLTILA